MAGPVFDLGKSLYASYVCDKQPLAQLKTNRQDAANSCVNMPSIMERMPSFQCGMAQLSLWRV